MEKELIEFLKYIKEVHTDSYGHLEICDSGDELDPTVERVVKEYMKLKNKQLGDEMESIQYMKVRSISGT